MARYMYASAALHAALACMLLGGEYSNARGGANTNRCSPTS